MRDGICKHCNKPWGIHWAPDALCSLDEGTSHFEVDDPIANLERVVIERAVEWKQTEGDGHAECEALDKAVDALLRERRNYPHEGAGVGKLNRESNPREKP